VESGDIFSSVRALFFGVTVGGVTLSLSTILLAIVFFAGGIFATRAVQRWLQTKYLPHTHLDAGLRNSITMGFGYLGVVLTSAVSVSYLGLSLDKLTIVAGALSVGIGFGLQSIVNNFVSGLIILAERSIRVGDWIVVSGEQGHVRRINVRATQIETFDRGTLIVPNSNLVSGIVKNWVHSDRTGRVLISLPVPRHADADQIAEMLRNAARDHSDVLEDPPPRVLFKTIKGDELSFDLTCFVPDVDMVSRVSSDLTFVVFRRLRDFGIGTPPGPPKFQIEGISDLREEVEALRLAFAKPRSSTAKEGGANGAGHSAAEKPSEEDPQA
jgi:potassium-dependent mechanosensitive channel